jgi:hypothetical protein
MKLMTKAITEKAQKQYPLGSDMNQKVVAKFFDPCGSWGWYVMNQDPNDPDYLWGIVKGNEVEMGSFSLSELESIERPFGLKLERDLHFQEMTAQEVWDKLNKGKHV